MQRTIWIVLSILIFAHISYADATVSGGGMQSRAGVSNLMEFDNVTFTGNGIWESSISAQEASASSWAEFQPRLLTVDFDLFLAPIDDLQAWHTSITTFSVDVQSYYSATGWTTGSEPDGGWVEFTVSLHQSGPVFLFGDVQTSTSTPNETLILFDTDGDYSTSRLGSTHGWLVVGETYTFTTRTWIWKEQPAGPNNVIRSGGFTLSIIPVPEPSGGLLLGAGVIGLVGLAGHRKRRLAGPAAPSYKTHRI